MEPMSDNEESDFQYEPPEPHQDPIAAGAFLDANLPIMDARDYCLRILPFHIQDVSTRWKDVTEMIKDPFEAHVRDVHFG